jgi:hypothetical protein
VGPSGRAQEREGGVTWKLRSAALRTLQDEVSQAETAPTANNLRNALNHLQELIEVVDSLNEQVGLIGQGNEFRKFGQEPTAEKEAL